MAEVFQSHLKVDKKIVEILSKSTYQKSFSSAIRELVSNAYDADSLSVAIDFDDSFKFIEIKDDGNGMTKPEFDKYLTIGATKQATQFTRKYKRKRIGQFGIGFLSIFPFCETLEITTTSENSDEVLTARIPAGQFFTHIGKKDSAEKSSPMLVDEIPIKGEIVINPKERLKHYTIIKLINPTKLVLQYFTRPSTNKTASIDYYEPINRFKWELQEDLPINLSLRSKYYRQYKYDEPIEIRVFVNGDELFRNDYLDQVIAEGTEKIGDIVCKYIFTTNHNSVKPLQARGIKFRVNNVGIGSRTDFELKRDRGFSRLHWITGEIFFSEQIKEHLSITRDYFISNAVIDEIHDFFANKLRSLANEIEAVAVAEKEIERIDYKRRDATIPRQDILASNLNKLETKGFNIVEVDGSSKQSEIRIDKASKVVYVPKAVKEQKEYLQVLNETIEILYDKWDVNDVEPACRRIAKNQIVVNQNYPLFRSKTYGNVFKKLSVLLLLVSEQTNTSGQFYKKINQSVLNNFEDLL